MIACQSSRALAEISGDAGNLVHRLQDERASAIKVLNSPAAAADQAKTAYREQQEKTDAANNVYRVSRSTLADVPANLRELLDQIQTQLGELPVIKSITQHPTTGQIAYTQADHPNWWTKHIRFLNPEETCSVPGEEFYKVRWNVPAE